MQLPLAREGYPFIAASAAIAAILWVTQGFLQHRVIVVVAGIATALCGSLLFFFRDPPRSGARGPDLVIAPADGRVIEVSRIEEAEYLGGSSLRVSIFLSLLDVHVNRYPVSGRVEYRNYEAGGFQAAWRRSAAEGNERASTGIRTGDRPVLVRQVAGWVARRIVTYPEVGDEVSQGERMGVILFGSRLDVYLPGDAQSEVDVGQRARGGVTVLARLATEVEPT